ncbi:hypothetical protein NPS01_25180 [Nocardioides psychrotolerans]|uniref:Uncharacterized protein n=1 Tax=Nocardioides psychrotolerans TaxID=1005945 RepID=A0A1I3LLK2_9ACTN|nr:hypothetical protein [Nocardioides psychrotolerans]GEP38855.1 hypothetical protein NPS01_25180 [Nocardioides psychrotolerans]SFI85592.1 hypothetical protein SAMN05216561_11420 [Nocardioides psychrotolerans]
MSSQPLHLVGRVVPAAEFQPDPVEVAIAAERADGIARSHAHRVAGNHGRAHYEIQRSFQRQLRIAGLGTQDTVVDCVCGGRCKGAHR